MRKRELILTRRKMGNKYTVAQNRDYALQACADSMKRGRNPISPILAYSDFMPLHIESSLRLYLLLSSEWGAVVDKIAVYIRPGEPYDDEVKEILRLTLQHNGTKPVQIHIMTENGDPLDVQDWIQEGSK